MKKLITTWETNDKLSLKTRERYLHMEEKYLRDKQRHPAVEDGPVIKRDKDYVLYGNDLYILLEETRNATDTEDVLVIVKNNYYAVVNKKEYSKKENSKIWKKET